MRRFQSTPSGGKATCSGGVFMAHCAGVSIHAFRGEGDPRRCAGHTGPGVSIHAFRGEGDQRRHLRPGKIRVSIHAFRGEGDSPRIGQTSEDNRFQSTPSGGKATPRSCSGQCMSRRFNPRLPGGRRHARAGASSPQHRGVSIHAFRGEGDCTTARRRLIWSGFNPRLPGGRRPRRWCRCWLRR